MYTKHALENLYPSGIGMPAGHTSLHHPIGVSQKMINAVLDNKLVSKHISNAFPNKAEYSAGDIRIIVEDNVVITVMRVS